MSPFVKFSHKLCPLFNRFSTFDKNVNLSKANPEAKFFFLAFPSLKYLDFYDVSKNSEHIKTFSRGLTQKSTPKMEKFFKLSSIMANKNFYPIVTGKKII